MQLFVIGLRFHERAMSYEMHSCVLHELRTGISFATKPDLHNDDVIMGTIASQITSLAIVYSTVHSGADQRKHQSSASLAFVRGIHRRPVNSPHKWPVTRKMFPFDDVIMEIGWVKYMCILSSLSNIALDLAHGKYLHPIIRWVI